MVLLLPLLLSWTGDAPPSTLLQLPLPCSEAPRQLMDEVMIQFLAEISPIQQLFSSVLL